MTFAWRLRLVTMMQIAVGENAKKLDKLTSGPLLARSATLRKGR